MTDARFPERWLNDRRVMRLRGEQFKFFVISLAWSVANRTDGRLSGDDLSAIPGGGIEMAYAMVAAELWKYDFDQFRHDEAQPVPVFHIVDFEETQATKADLAALAAARKKARDKKREQRAAAARSGSGSDVPGDVPGDTTRTGQARTGVSTKTEGQVLTTTPPQSRNPLDHDGSMPVVPDDQHIPVNGSADASVQTVTRASCPECGRNTKVKPDGRLWIHGSRISPCPGTGAAVTS